MIQDDAKTIYLKLIQFNKNILKILIVYRTKCSNASKQNLPGSLNLKFLFKFIIKIISVFVIEKSNISYFHSYVLLMDLHIGIVSLCIYLNNI